MPAYYGETANACALDRCMEHCKKMFNWDEKYPVRDMGNGKVRAAGVGMAMQGSCISNLDVGSATLKLNEDGGYNLLIGAADMGTGCDTILAQMAAECMDCSVDDIAVFGADTDASPYDSGSYASSTTYITGKAVEKACADLKKKICEIAAQMMNCEKEDVAFESSRVRCISTGQTVSLSEIAYKTQLASNSNAEATASHFSPVSPPPYMVGMAEIELDKLTGEVKVLDFTPQGGSRVPACSAPRGSMRASTPTGERHLTSLQSGVFIMNMQDFYTGHAFDAYEFFGAHTYFGGTHFAVWAPSAQHIAVETEIGTFDLHRTQSAVWECDAPGVQAGMVYQYWVRGANGQSVAHCDPYGTAMTLRPDGRSIVSDAPKGFADDKWMQERTKCFDKPLNIYEVHAGSWRQKEDGSWYTYAELADLLPAYCKKNGFTHIELMPLAEHPFDGSWGYQTTGFFAPTSRYGTPDELVEFVNACHKQGIGVILDFVPVHFAVDAYGLKEFDGTPLYEYPAAAVGQSEWGSCNFMHSRGEIRCFIQSCADYWLRVFHADGLRMDAVSRLIYWQGDPNRGVNGSTLEFLKGMNAGLQQRHPTAILIAEDSTSFPKVTAPVEYGGLGFDYKWDLGWMNDTLDYFKKTSDERRENLGKLTFSMMYAWNEHYILPFSHDENVHGKATIVQKMYGEYEGKFPQARALYLYMAIHPGKMLDFMGNEFAQLREFDESREQDWMVLKYPNHDDFHRYRRALNEAYLANEAFWSREYDPEAFRWLDCAHPELDACAIWRDGHDGAVLAAFNFGDTELADYTLTLPRAGKLTKLLDTDWQCFGGRTEKPKRLVGKACGGELKLTLAPFSGQLFKLV